MRSRCNVNQEQWEEKATAKCSPRNCSHNRSSKKESFHIDHDGNSERRQTSGGNIKLIRFLSHVFPVCQLGVSNVSASFFQGYKNLSRKILDAVWATPRVGWGGVLPYITGMCRPKGSWFWSSFFRTGYPFQRRFLERGIIFRTHQSSTFVSSHLKLFQGQIAFKNTAQCVNKQTVVLLLPPRTEYKKLAHF